MHITKDRFAISPIFEHYKTLYRIKEFAPELIEFSDGMERNFSSKRDLYVGFGLTFYRIGIAISFKLPYSDIPELKESKSFNFIGGYSLKKFYGEFRFRNHDGLRQETFTYTKDTVIEEATILQNTHFRQIGGVLYYFSGEKYNYDANFKNYNVQKKSAISPVFIGGFNYYNMNGKFEEIDTSNTVLINHSVNIYSVKLAAGLAASLVYKKLYLSVISNLGIALNKNRLLFNNKAENRIDYFPSLEIKSSLGYNTNTYFASVSFIYDNDLIYFYSNKIGVNNYYLSVKVGYKLDSKYLGKAAKYL